MEVRFHLESVILMDILSGLIGLLTTSGSAVCGGKYFGSDYQDCSPTGMFFIFKNKIAIEWVILLCLTNTRVTK